MTPQILKLTAFALMALGAGAADDPASLSKRYEEAVRITHWSWSDQDADLVHSLAEASGPYDVVVVRRHDDAFSLRIKIMDGDREVYSWRGHGHSVFILQGERLFYPHGTND